MPGVRFVMLLLSQFQSHRGQIPETGIVFTSWELIYILVEFKEDL